MPNTAIPPTSPEFEPWTLALRAAALYRLRQSDRTYIRLRYPSCSVGISQWPLKYHQAVSWLHASAGILPAHDLEDRGNPASGGELRTDGSAGMQRPSQATRSSSSRGNLFSVATVQSFLFDALLFALPYNCAIRAAMQPLTVACITLSLLFINLVNGCHMGSVRLFDCSYCFTYL